MKKSLISIVAMSSIAFSASNSQIEQFVKEYLVRGDMPIKISSTKILDNGFEEVIFDIGGRKQVMFAKGDLLFPDIIDMKNKKSFAQELNSQIMNKEIANIYKKEDPKNIIIIGKNPNNPTQFIITDPECPYCRAELKKMHDQKDKINYKLILTSVHGKSGLEKAYLIYKEMKKAKTDNDKFAILDKYYAPSTTVDEKINDKDIKNIADIGNKYFNVGVRGVPFIVDEKDLK